MVSSRLKQVNRLRSTNRRYGRYVFFAGLVVFSIYQTYIVGNSGNIDGSQPQNMRKLLQTEDLQATQTFLQAMEANIGFDKRRRQLGAESSYSKNFVEDYSTRDWGAFTVETAEALQTACDAGCDSDDEIACVAVASESCQTDFKFDDCCMECPTENIYDESDGLRRDWHSSSPTDENPEDPGPEIHWPVCLGCKAEVARSVDEGDDSVFDSGSSVGATKIGSVWAVCPCNNYDGYTSIGLSTWLVEPFSEYGFLAYTLGIIYIFLGIAVVCDEFFVPALEVITERMALSDDVAGATLMAAGGSAPELFASMVGTFLSKNSVGFATIVGSAVFNVLFVIGMCAIFSKDVLELTWWPLFRDCTYYSLSLFMLAIFFGVNTPDLINAWEAFFLFGMYLGYVTLMYFNERLQAKVNGMLGKSKVAADPNSYSEKGIVPGSPAGLSRNPFARPAQFRAGILKLMYTQDFDVENMAIHVVADIAGDMEQTFKDIDSDRSGHIDPAELGKLMSKVMGYDSSPEQIQLALGMIDTNSDGQVEFEEFKKWYIASENKILAKTKAAFDAVDTSGDGVIDRNEMMAMLQKVGKQATEDDVNTAFKEFDQDGNGKISYDEFKGWYRNSMINKEDLEGLEGDGEDESEALDISIPDTVGGKIFWILSAPVVLPLYFTVPDVRKPKGQSWFLGLPIAGGEGWYVATWTLAIVWIGLFSTFMVFWATLFGDKFEIAPEVMGLTFLAAGTSIPDLLTSVIVARQGHGDMAVSSSVGSNIFDVLVGLPIPWILYTTINGVDVEVGGGGGTLFVSLLILFIMLIIVVSLIAAFKWKMTKGLGVTMFLMYFVFVLQDLARQDTGGTCYYGKQPVF